MKIIVTPPNVSTYHHPPCVRVPQLRRKQGTPRPLYQSTTHSAMSPSFASKESRQTDSSREILRETNGAQSCRRRTCNMVNLLIHLLRNKITPQYGILHPSSAEFSFSRILSCSIAMLDDGHQPILLAWSEDLFSIFPSAVCLVLHCLKLKKGILEHDHLFLLCIDSNFCIPLASTPEGRRNLKRSPRKTTSRVRQPE